MAVEVEHYMLLLCDKWQQRSTLTQWRLTRMHGTELLNVEKMAFIDIHQRLLNVYGDQTADVSTVRQWMVRFSSGDSNVEDKPCSGWP